MAAEILYLRVLTKRTSVNNLLEASAMVLRRILLAIVPMYVCLCTVLAVSLALTVSKIHCTVDCTDHTMSMPRKATVVAII